MIPVAKQLSELDSNSNDYATCFLDLLLVAAVEVGATDVHLHPLDDGLQVRWRRDGVLQDVGLFPRGGNADVTTRLKVMANLLTYRTEVPQEGRLRDAPGNSEMRVCTFPTLHGERAVVRMFAAGNQLQHLADLGLPEDIESAMRRLLTETSGVLLITGPAGSGKTTTAYACLRELAALSGVPRSLVSLEDPIEVSLPGVAQAQIDPGRNLTLAQGLKSMLRQDPEVLLVGEIRDAETAEAALQASLTGHLLISTFHAGSAAAAISRLADMGIEPYVLRSSILGVINQRLVRQLCTCSHRSADPDERLGLAVPHVYVPQGCEQCDQIGYRGRLLIAELLEATQPELRDAILRREDAGTIERLACEAGMVSRWDRATRTVEAGGSSAAEIRRVFGFGDNRGSTD